MKWSILFCYKPWQSYHHLHLLIRTKKVRTLLFQDKSMADHDNSVHTQNQGVLFWAFLYILGISLRNIFYITPDLLDLHVSILSESIVQIIRERTAFLGGGQNWSCGEYVLQSWQKTSYDSCRRKRAAVCFMAFFGGWEAKRYQKWWRKWSLKMANKNQKYFGRWNIESIKNITDKRHLMTVAAESGQPFVFQLFLKVGNKIFRE